MSGGDYHRRVVDWRAKLDEAGREQQRPLWFSDQVAAAQREAHDVIVAASADPRFRGVSKIDASIAPRWLAALDGVLWCPHLRGCHNPQPTFVDLNHRRACCARCIRTVLRPIVDDRCELCSSRGHMQFVEAMVQIGLVLFFGNLGPCCQDALPTDAS